MLKVENITKYYKKNCAVDNLSFSVEKGEIFGLLGENGAGKTTTFRIIMGLLDSDNGVVTLDGKKIDYKVSDHIGYLPEERSLMKKMTVKEQVLFYGVLKGMNPKDIEKRLDSLLEEFEIQDYKERKISELSKGNQQKIQFIISFINNPKLLILDEPFSGLDPINVELFKNKIRELVKKGTSIIFSSHQLEHIEEFCKKIVILSKGKTVIAGDVDKIKKEYRKHNIFIEGTFDVDKVKKIKGVIELKKVNDEYHVKIDSYDIVSKVFKAISDQDIVKFVVEEATLNEIFIAKVGELNGKKV